MISYSKEYIGNILFLGGLFGKKKSFIYGLEEKDIAISREIMDLLSRVQSNLNELRTFIDANDITSINASLSELRNKFILLKSKAEAILVDVQSIMNKEIQLKNSILLNDEEYLQDKYQNLNSMVQELDSLIEIIGARPSTEELRNEYMGFMFGKLNSIIDSANKIINDDRELEHVYASIDQL